MQNFNAGVGAALLHAVQRVERDRRVAGLRDVHGQPVRQLQLPVLPADVHLAGSDGRSRPSIPVKGIRIGINGTIPQVGQAYIPLNTTVTAANYTAQGEVLSNIGTVIGLQSGPLTDQFFLHLRSCSAARPTWWSSRRRPRRRLAPGPVVADIGVRTFAQVNSTLSALTGVPTSNPNVSRDLPGGAAAAAGDSDARGLLLGEPGRHRAAGDPVLQRDGQHTRRCQAQMFPGVTFSAGLFATQAGIDSVTGPLAARVLGSGLHSQPAASTMTGPTASSTT